VAGAEDRRVALLSIRPRFADAILAGEKTVELRRVGFARDVEHVLVYATAPVQAVVGWFRVTAIDRDRPTRLWQRYQSTVGVSRQEFRRYFQGVRTGVAILIGEVGTLMSPVSLRDVYVNAAPRNFCYPRNGAARLLPSLRNA
jgi:predicted transcriptional regulator